MSLRLNRGSLYRCTGRARVIYAENQYHDAGSATIRSDGEERIIRIVVRRIHAVVQFKPINDGYN